MKRILAAGAVLAGLALLAGEAAAQTGTARGKVVDDKDQVIEGVAVLIEYQGGLTRKSETKTNKYKKIPKRFEKEIPDDLKALLEFPGFASDNISKMKARYVEQGRVPDHRRHGWIRTLA